MIGFGPWEMTDSFMHLQGGFDEVVKLVPAGKKTLLHSVNDTSREMNPFVHRDLIFKLE